MIVEYSMEQRGTVIKMANKQKALSIKKITQAIFLSFVAFVLVLQPLLVVGQWKFDRALAATDDYVSPENMFIDNNPIDSLQELKPILKKKPPLRLAPQDVNNIRDNRVDTRVVSYLIYLVTPVEQGGAGLDYIKTQRILKNYDTGGTGKFDRETLASIEEGSGIVSAHKTGQAIDISEVGAITCKIIKKRLIGGNSTSFKSPKPIKVAWQTRDGVNRHPTPTGASFFEMSGNMSVQSILLMLNESGEMDELSDFVRGLSISEIFQYVGANILIKSYGVDRVSADPRSGKLPNVLGALLLQKYIPGLPDGLPLADQGQDIRIAIARAHAEELLNLPPGSLRGNGWDEVLTSAGKRTIENSLGIPGLILERETLKDVLKNPSAQAALKEFVDSDDAFSVMPGTIDLISNGDEKGLKYAGVNIVADALRLNTDQRNRLENAVRNSQKPNINTANTGTDRNVPTNTLQAIFENKNTEPILKAYGQKYLDELLSGVVPSEFTGLTNDIIRNLSSSTTNVIYGELQKNIGIKKIASDSSIAPNKVDNLNTSKHYPLIANTLNKQFQATGNTQLTVSDIDNMLNGSGDKVVSKIGGIQADKAIGWNVGTGYAIISGAKTFDQGLGEMFGNAIGALVGLHQGTTVDLSGDINRNYGDAIIGERLGINIAGDGSASSIDKNALYSAFNIRDGRSLTDLRSDSGFWAGTKITKSLEYTDIRIGAPIGTSKSYLLGEINNSSLSKLVAKKNLSNVTEDRLIDFLDLDEAFNLNTDDTRLLVSTIVNWDNASFEDKDKTINLGKKMMGRSLDQRTAFEKDTFLTFIQGDTTGAAVKVLIQQGVRQFATAIGSGAEGFDEGNLTSLTKYLIDSYSGIDTTITDDEKFSLISKATKIPLEFEDDIRAFVNGNLRAGMEAWSAAMMVDFANKYLSSEASLTYEEMRNAIDLTDINLINTRAQVIAESNGGSTQDYLEQARKELMQEFRDNGKYKISDAFLIQAEIPIPINFSKTMFSGSNQDRMGMFTSSMFLYLDRALIDNDRSYKPGTLERLYNGDTSLVAEMDTIISSILSTQTSIGSFSAGFIKDFYQFIKASDKNSFYKDTQYDSMWQYMENWFDNTLGVNGLTPGYVKSIYYASQNDWKLDDGGGVVLSVKDIGIDLVGSRITRWADKTMGIPTGSTYRMYKAINELAAASRAGDAARISQAEANLTGLAISIALNACEACQQFFASVDKILAAPPGFTNALVGGAIAMAFGLGPAGLIAAAAIYLFGFYAVDYKCPIPPPGDWYAFTQFDSPQDAIDPFTSDYYKSPDQLIKDRPAPGENPFDWDDGVPFVDGDNSELWMAWSRYFTGKLLAATLSYGAAQDGAGKPLQIITYRQANVEYFYQGSIETFGPGEVGNSRLGLGFTQNSTKTTDWVHTSFGGYF